MKCPHCKQEMLVEKLRSFDTVYACYFCMKLYSVFNGQVEGEWGMKADYQSPRWGADDSWSFDAELDE